MFRRKNILDKLRFMFGYNSIVSAIKDFRDMDKAFFNTKLKDVGRKNLVDFARYMTMIKILKGYTGGFVWTV